LTQSNRKRFQRIRWSLARVRAAAIVLAVTGAGCDGGSALMPGGDQAPDPVVVDFPLAYIKRPLVVEGNGTPLTVDARRSTRFFPGAELMLRERASPSAVEVSLTAALFPPDENGAPARYDVRDLSASYDGRALLFALRAPALPDVGPEEQPTWNVWVYHVGDDEPRRVIRSDIVAEGGDDVAPRFLPDGRIVFASTRQRQSRAVLLDEGRPQFAALEESRTDPALVLHVMTAQGADIRQITFNQSHDMDPAVLDDGRIVYSRWDNAGTRNRISLYTVRPDGREQQRLYGTHSHLTGPDGQRIAFRRPFPLLDGRLLSTLMPDAVQPHIGVLHAVIDSESFVDALQPVHGAVGHPGPAQMPLVDGDLRLDEAPSPRGRFVSASPLYDGSSRVLATWSQCWLEDAISNPAEPRAVPCSDGLLALPDVPEAAPRVGIWMYDPDTGTQLPIVVPRDGVVFTDALVLEPRPLPAVLLDAVPGLDVDADLAAEGVGVLHVRSVYDVDGTASVDIERLRDPALTSASDRPARFLRIVKPVSMPGRDVVNVPGTAFGVSQAKLMREILGYTALEPDGSVAVKVPADVAFTVEVLDADGRRIGERHQQWLQLRPGEVMNCTGCHASGSGLAHGRYDAEPPSANPGAPLDGAPFLNTRAERLALQGESMAETRARAGGVDAPSVDLVDVDHWTDPDRRSPDPTRVLSYANLRSTPPVAPDCVGSWHARCRIVINYETHIHPLWTITRPELDEFGNVVADRTCRECHGTVDDMNVVQVPAAHLNLDDGVSPVQAAHFHSYRQLLLGRTELEVVDGVLIERLVQATDGAGNPRYLTDENGELILDAQGDPIPVMVTVPVPRPMSPAGARASARFFARFDAGGSHEGWLSPDELKLIAEWLDLGAQYYNDPFAVPR
jgi:hypothetical protein